MKKPAKKKITKEKKTKKDIKLPSFSLDGKKLSSKMTFRREDMYNDDFDKKLKKSLK